jgi:hypothetical protein
VNEQLALDTTSADISPAYVQSGSVKSPSHIKAAGKDGGEFFESDIPSEYTLKELMDVFDQLGRGDLQPEQRIELTRRAQGYLAQLRGGNGQNPVAAEIHALQPLLLLAQDGDMAAVIQELPSPTNNGVMKIRVPFYVSGSVVRAPNIPGKLHFGADKLERIVQEGNKRIADGKQPITVYARHAHAIAKDKLPVGRVVGLERHGGIGYAIEEIAPTADGRDVQTLARNKMLNAVSLRANGESYTLEPILINGEEAWDVDLTLDGIDFAPDGPAQPTYGVEVLAAEARVEPAKSSTRSVILSQDVLTLEAVKRDRPDLIVAIEAPFKEANAKLTQELDAAKVALTQANEDLGKAKEQLGVIERTAYMQELAAKFPEPVKALSVIQETCKDEKTKEAIASKVMPLLLDALSQKAPLTPAPAAPPTNPFLDLFPNSGAGQTLGLEALSEKKEVGEVVTGLPIPA